MDRIGSLLLNIAVALYLFANGILGFDKKGDFHDMANAIFGRNSDLGGIVAIILSVIALVAGVLLILQLFKIAIPRIELIMLIIIIVWVVFMVIVDVLALIQGNYKNNLLGYLVQLASHSMVLGALLLTTRK